MMRLKYLMILLLLVTFFNGCDDKKTEETESQKINRLTNER
jgi:hypothetical protein